MADCKKIIELVEDARNRTAKDDAVKAGTLAYTAFKVFRVLSGAANPYLYAAVKAVTPTSIGTGVEGYYTALKEYIRAIDAGAEPGSLAPLVERLRQAEKDILMEKEFGINTNCYSSIHQITEDAANHVAGGKAAPPLP